MTLALLLTAVTGAWAISDPNSVYWTNEIWAGWAENVTTHTVGDITITCSGNAKAYQSTSSNNPLALQAGANDAITFTSNGKPFASVAIMTDDELNVAGWTYNSSKWSYEWSGEPTTSVTLSGCNINADVIIFTFGTAETPVTVEWNASTKTGTFAMPASDVVLTPIYAKAATFATTGTEPEVKTLLPEAAEGVIAGTDASLIAEGTGIVAFAGTSTTVKQGTVMYAVTPATVTEAPALDAANKWSADVPTAKLVADGGIDVLVWYYIKGADTPDGEAATLDNTFDDTEPASLTVTVLTNKFDITFNAANANTIEAGKATVTVGGAAATVTEGKLEGVKMGSEVKLEAKPGYKFRKVEVKKAASTPSLNITNPVVGQVIGSDGKNYAAANVPSGVDKVAMIAYVSGSNGLAIALADDGYMNWSTAQTTCAAHTPVFSNGTWKLPTQDEWKQMFGANGGNEGKYTGLNTAITTAGGTAFQNGTVRYWSSSEYNSEQAYQMQLYSGDAIWFNDWKVNEQWVRAVLAF